MQMLYSQSVRIISNRGFGMLLLLMLVFQLTGCGWRLRGSYDFPAVMERVYVKGAARYSDLGNVIHNALQGTNVKTVSTADSATAVLQVLTNKSSQRILSTDSSGRASEYEISYQLSFNVIDDKGKQVVPDQSITAKREYRFDPANVLATSGEVQRLKQDMLRNAVQQMLRRINALLANP